MWCIYIVEFTHTHTHTHIYIYMCVCVCVCVWLDKTDNLCLPIPSFILSSLYISRLTFGLNEFRKGPYYLLLASPKITLVGSENSCEKSSSFRNLVYPKIKSFPRWLELIKDRIGKHEVSILFTQTSLKKKMLHTHIYIYIYIKSNHPTTQPTNHPLHTASMWGYGM